MNNKKGMKMVALHVQTWWKQWKEQRRKRSEERRKERCRRRAEYTIQLMEYAGEIYVSFDGRPVVPSDAIIGDMCVAVDESRKAYASYLFDHGLSN